VRGQPAQPSGADGSRISAKTINVQTNWPEVVRMTGVVAPLPVSDWSCLCWRGTLEAGEMPVGDRLERLADEQTAGSDHSRRRARAVCRRPARTGTDSSAERAAPGKNEEGWRSARGRASRQRARSSW